MSFKKRSVKKSNHRDKSLNKNAINAIILSYKYYHKKLRLFKKAYKRFKTLGVFTQFVIILFNSSWCYSWRGNYESHRTWHYTR